MLAAILLVATLGPEKVSIVHADKVYTSAGQVIENGSVAIGADGKIVAIGPGGSGDGPRVAAITAGMVDASARVDAGTTTVEQSEEIQPDLRVAHTLDLFDVAWRRQLTSGVTTVLAVPADYNVIGGLGIVLKTGGAATLEARTVRADAVLRGAMGTQPSWSNHPAFRVPTDFYSRRPTTRMGVEWEWRKAFFDAGQGLDVRGAEVLKRALAGELPVVIQAWATQDIRTAVFLKEEMVREGFGEPSFVLDAAAEAWKEPELLVRSKTPVVLPPFPADGRTGDGAFLPWNAAKTLHEAGIPFALSSHGALAPESRLAAQAGYAIRGGLDFESALAAVTIVPARLLGVSDRVGSLEVGKDADLALWNGTPFELTSRVVGVVLDGDLVLDPRQRTGE